MNTTPPTTEQRLSRLETQSRRWRLAAVGLAGLVIGGLVTGFGPTRTDYQPIDDEFLDYLEAGGVLPVPKVVQFGTSYAQGYLENLENPGFGFGTNTPLISRVFADGSVEALAVTSSQTLQWDYDEGVWYTKQKTNLPDLRAIQWQPVRISDRP